LVPKASKRREWGKLPRLAASEGPAGAGFWKKEAKMKTLSILVCLTVVLVLAGSATAVTRNWDGDGSDGQWTTAANWSDDTKPTGSDDANIDGSTTAYTVTLSGTEVVDAVGVQNASTLTVATGATLTVNGAGTYGTFWISKAAAEINVQGTVILQDGNEYGLYQQYDGVLNISGLLRVGNTDYAPSAPGYGSITENSTLGDNYIYLTGGGKLVAYGDTMSSDPSGSSLRTAVTTGRIYQNGSVVGTDDLVLTDANGNPWVSGTKYTAIVPEPATVAILGLGSLVLLRRRR
jgi:hypothetical protein